MDKQIPLATLTNKGAELSARHETDGVFAKLVQSQKISWEPGNRKTTYENMLTLNAHGAPLSLAAVGFAVTTDNPIPATRRRSAIASRQVRARPEVEALHDWLTATPAWVPGRGDLATAIRYSVSRWTALTRHRDDGHPAIDNNAAERAIRPLTLGRKNWLFCCSDGGGTRAAAIMSLVQTARLNNLNPAAYLRNVFKHVAHYTVNCVVELLPWNVNDIANRLSQH